MLPLLPLAAQQARVSRLFRQLRRVFGEGELMAAQAEAEWYPSGADLPARQVQLAGEVVNLSPDRCAAPLSQLQYSRASECVEAHRIR